MKERPILMSPPMVRVALDGSKTQTRRVAKLNASGRVAIAGRNWHPDDPEAVKACPYGQPGDRLYVREGFCIESNRGIEPESVYPPPFNDGRPVLRVDDPDEGKFWKQCHYRATDPYPELYYEDGDGEPECRWKPSIHMPRWASRIILEITDVRLQQLHDISEADADAEGCERLDSDRDEPDWMLCPQCGGTRLYTAFSYGGGALPDTDCLVCDTYQKRYRHLWESINGFGSWEKNPLVWCVTFKRVMA